MFDFQLTKVFKSVFGANFLGISSMDFSKGSVIVDSVVQLSKPSSEEDLDKTKDDVYDTFNRKGFVIDRVNMTKILGG